jgi:signal transduction histidine kinase
VFQSVLSLYRESTEDFDEVEINPLVLDTIPLLRNELVEHGIAVVTNLAPGLPPVTGSHRQLQEVLLNLIQNAIEAMAATTSRSRVISLASRPLDSSSILVSLEDTGPGIDSHKLRSIFDPFVTTRAGGTGLGLGICKLVIDRHGGRLSAAAGAAGGARFEITLPTKMTAPSLESAVGQPDLVLP